MKAEIRLRFLIKNDLIDELGSNDKMSINENKDLSKPDIFNVAFLGPKSLRIYNDCWRDYTEYFHVDINKKKLLTINVNAFDSPEIAFQNLVLKIKNILQT